MDGACPATGLVSKGSMDSDTAASPDGGGGGDAAGLA